MPNEDGERVPLNPFLNEMNCEGGVRHISWRVGLFIEYSLKPVQNIEESNPTEHNIQTDVNLFTTFYFTFKIYHVRQNLN